MTQGDPQLTKDESLPAVYSAEVQQPARTQADHGGRSGAVTCGGGGLRYRTRVRARSLLVFQLLAAAVCALDALGQIPSAEAAAGILFVVVAGIGATRSGARTPQPHNHRDATPAAARGAV